MNKSIPTINEYGEDNAARALHHFVVIYFGGDYDRAFNFIKETIIYRNMHVNN